MRTHACSVLEPLHCCPCLCFPPTEPDDSPNSSWGLPKDPQPHSKPHGRLCCRLKKSLVLDLLTMSYYSQRFPLDHIRSLFGK